MRITGIRTLTTLHRWGRPIGDVNGHVASGVTSIPIVLVDTDAGLTGVGLGHHDGVERIAAVLTGEDPRATWGLYDRMLASVFKAGHAGINFGAIGALDMALWDLKAKAAEQPLWRLLGARTPVVPAYASALDGPLTEDQLVAVHAPFARAGFRAVKLKGGVDLAADLRRFALITELYADITGVAPRLMLDANESWSRKEAVSYLHRLERHLDVAWIEEPVRRWDAEGHALITRSVRAAVATGENLTGLEQFRPLIQAGAVDIVQTGSVWGISHFLRVATLAQAFDLPVSPVGYNANPLAHAAASLPNHLSLEIQDLNPPVAISTDQRIVDGELILGEEPGLGYGVDEEMVATLAHSADWGDAAGPHMRPETAGRRLIAPQAHPYASADDGIGPPLT